MDVVLLLASVALFIELVPSLDSEYSRVRLGLNADGSSLGFSMATRLFSTVEFPLLSTRYKLKVVYSVKFAMYISVGPVVNGFSPPL